MLKMFRIALCGTVAGCKHKGPVREVVRDSHTKSKRKTEVTCTSSAGVSLKEAARGCRLAPSPSMECRSPIGCGRSLVVNVPCHRLVPTRGAWPHTRSPAVFLRYFLCAKVTKYNGRKVDFLQYFFVLFNLCVRLYSICACTYSQVARSLKIFVTCLSLRLFPTLPRFPLLR